MRPLTQPQETAIKAARRRGRGNGRQPTVGEYRSEGMAGVWVTCLGSVNLQRCHHSRIVQWDQLPVESEWAFAEIGRRLRFRCDVCGGHDVHVTPDWSHARCPGMAMAEPRPT